MKKTLKNLVLVLCLVLCVSLLALPTMAATATQDGMEISLTTDKAEYAADETIVATLTVKNTNTTEVPNVVLTHNASGLTVAGGAATKNVGTLAAGASDSLEISYTVPEGGVEAPPAKTGDMVTVVIALAAVSGTAALVLINKKAGAMVMALVLVCGIVAFAVPAQAATEPASVSTTVKVDGEDVTLTASVSYGAPVVHSVSCGPEEMVYAKGTVNADAYKAHTEKIDGKDVYVLTTNGWATEFHAAQTTHFVDGVQPDGKLQEVRASLIEKGYQYCSITFQLSEGAKIGVYMTAPKLSENFKGETVGLVFTAGGTVAPNPNYVDDYADWLYVYCDGERVANNSSVSAGKWYTVVIKLLLDTEIAYQGEASWCQLALNNANNKPVYVSDVTYWLDDTFKTTLTN